MDEDVESDLKLEIAHILTIDVVAYSTLLINEQSRQLRELTQAVRDAPRFRDAEMEGKLLRLPTGDGMVLVFLNDAEAAIECAMQITASLKQHPEIRLRMGIHSGPVNPIRDVNDRSNVTGAGIDMAQRVLDCGDAGHILVSKRVADDLSPHPRWNQCLHALGECEVKHGQKISLFNFYSDSLGNPELPQKLKCTPEPKKSRRLVPGGKALLFGTLGLAICLAVAFFLTRTPPSKHSIAVLPFLDLSQTKDQEYFSDGITEEIIDSLAHVHGLFVVARTTAFSFKNKNPDIREVGRQLGVSHVLEGSVSHGPGKVRVVAQLINVVTGYHLWSETYDSTEKDLLSLQSDVAKKVANALQIELQLVETTQLAKPLTQDPEAYDLYLRGRYLLNKRTVDSIQKALVLFQEAVAKDAQFALGRAGVADSYILLGMIGAMPGQEAAARAWPEVSSALTIDPQLAEGYVSRAILLTDFEWNWPAAEIDFQKALALNPNSAAGHRWYARHLEQLGRSEEALREIVAAQKNDPLSPTIWVAKGNILFVAHRYQEAIDSCKKALELEQHFASAYQVLGQIYAHLGEHAKAIEAATKYVELSEGTGWSMLELAYVYAVAGNRAESDRIVKKVTTGSGEFSPYDMATIRSAWHDAAGAMPWLERAIKQRSVDVILIRVDPRLDNVRSDPRFKEILAQAVPR
jgi:TolB-like protein/Flp pilus assembly protein TadD